MKTSLTILTTLAYLAVCAFHTDKHVPSTSASDCKDGYMKIWDTTKGCGGEATSKLFAISGDTLELPYCTVFKDTGRVYCQRDAQGRCHCVSTVNTTHVVPYFYVSRKNQIKLSLNAKQQKHFDGFKSKMFASVKDDALRTELWFELTSLENAIKSNDPVSYMTGLAHLEESWKKVN